MTAPKPAPDLTLPQTICLLALSRGEQPPTFRRLYKITDAGRQALAASPHLVEAQRALDEGKQGRPWQ